MTPRTSAILRASLGLALLVPGCTPSPEQGLASASTASTASNGSNVSTGTGSSTASTDNSTQAPGSGKEKSLWAFMKVHEVLTSPRCINCHPSGDHPTQGEYLEPHRPVVTRGEDGRGSIGMRCATCHGPENAGPMPGAPDWHLAPLSMGWQGKTAKQICEQLKDPARNGGKSVLQLIEHHANDPFVGWAWAPGGSRQPAPGTREAFVARTREWVESGAHCPDP